MVKLWLMLELGNYKNRVKGYLGIIGIYILPTLLIALLEYFKSPSLILSSKGIIVSLVISNLAIISITHYLIHKFFFKKLENDVLIKFLPDKINEYIKVRLLMLLIKWNLPFIVSSILSFKKILKVSNAVFLIGTVLFVISWFIINFLIAIYTRYILNVLRGKTEKLVKVILFLICIILIMVLPQYSVLVLLKELSLGIKNGININYINVNIFHIIALLLIFATSMFILKVSDNSSFKINIRKIVINKSVNIKFKKNKKSVRYFSKLIKIILGNLPDLEREILIKDLKDFVRDNKITLYSVIFLQLFINLFMLYIYKNIEVKNILGSVELFVSLNVVLFIFMGIMYLFMGRLSLKDNLEIDKDMEILTRYNIYVTKSNLISIKRKLANICLFYPMFMFYPIAFIININIWSWYGIVLSIIPIIIIKKLLSLSLIRKVNKENSTSVLLKIVNMILVGGACVLYLQLLDGESTLPFQNSLVLWGIINMLLVIDYAINLNIYKIKREKI